MRDDGVPARVGASFIIGLTVAHVGAAFAFAPLLGILLPLKAAAIDPAQKSLLLSRLLFWGAITASVANVLFGALSDSTRQRFGRRPWMVAGLLGSLAAYVLIGRANGPFSLLLGVVAFQFAFNALYAPLAALFPDRVPDRQKGLVAGCMAVGYPLGAGSGAWVVGRLLSQDTARLWAIAAVLTLSVAPFVLRVREGRRQEGPPASPSVEPAPAAKGGYRDFILAWLARFLVQTAFFIPTAYGLFYVQDVLAYGRGSGARPEAGYALLTLVSTAANLLACLTLGWWSDRLGRRKPLVAAAAVVLGLALLVAAHGVSWGGALAVWAALGAGLGGFIAWRARWWRNCCRRPGARGATLGS